MNTLDVKESNHRIEELKRSYQSPSYQKEYILEGSSHKAENLKRSSPNNSYHREYVYETSDPLYERDIRKPYLLDEFGGERAENYEYRVSSYNY